MEQEQDGMPDPREAAINHEIQRRLAEEIGRGVIEAHAKQVRLEVAEREKHELRGRVEEMVTAVDELRALAEGGAGREQALTEEVARLKARRRKPAGGRRPAT